MLEVLLVHLTRQVRLLRREWLFERVVGQHRRRSGQGACGIVARPRGVARLVRLSGADAAVDLPVGWGLQVGRGRRDGLGMRVRIVRQVLWVGEMTCILLPVRLGWAWAWTWTDDGSRWEWRSSRSRSRSRRGEGGRGRGSKSRARGRDRGRRAIAADEIGIKVIVTVIRTSGPVAGLVLERHLMVDTHTHRHRASSTHTHIGTHLHARK